MSDRSDLEESATPRVIVAVCTHRRNELLQRLLASIEASAADTPSAQVGVVVVDDNDDARAAPIAEAWDPHFALGVAYRHAGTGNISVARNLAISTAAALGDWTAMTDDDCEVSPRWLSALLDAVADGRADAATGPLRLTVPDGSPRWLTDQPFLSDGQFDFADGAVMETAATNNSMVSSAWLRNHPEHRFTDELGVIGGEDMVFYRTARRAGLRIRFAAEAVVVGHETPDRTTFRAVLRSRLWLGNTEAVTNLTTGDTGRARLVLRAGRRLASALARPLRQRLVGRPAELRYAAGLVCRSVGLVLGVVGVRLRHH